MKVESAETITKAVLQAIKQTSRLEVLLFFAGMAAAVFLPVLFK